MQSETLEVSGDPVVLRFFYPKDREPISTVLIAPAMGVGQRYYTALAVWLAEQGVLAVTFDYRGIGLSRHKRLRELDTDIISWAEQDCAAVLARVREVSGSTSITWLGHSLGGQIISLVPNRHEVSQVVTIACGSGYWRENTPELKRFSWWLWFFVAPVALRLFGYFPGKRLRKVGDLPGGVMAQWRRWCLNPEYAVGAEGEKVRALFASLSMPVSALSFSDDEYMSLRNVESLHGFFSGAPVDIATVSPAASGVSAIGHFGFFRAGNENALWRQYLLPRLAGS